MNTTTAKITEYTIPEQAANPYDVWPDLDGNNWFPDSPNVDRSAMIGKFNTTWTKITSFGAFYVNGPPGYPLKTTASSSATSAPSR